MRVERFFAHSLLFGLGLCLAACGPANQSADTVPNDSASSPLLASEAPASLPQIGVQPAPHNIMVNGSLTLISNQGTTSLTPISDGQAFDMQISNIGTSYIVHLVDLASEYKTQWKMEMTRAPIYGNQNWSLTLTPAHQDPLSCGGMTLQLSNGTPSFTPCNNTTVSINTDKKGLSLGLNGTQILKSFGTETGQVSGSLNIVFPATLPITRLEDYPSRYSGTASIIDMDASISALTPILEKNDTPARIEVQLTAPNLGRGLTLAPNHASIVLTDQTIPGQSTHFSCGRQLTEAEYACLEAPITLGPRCDTSFLAEAKQCKTVAFIQTPTGLEASFSETLFDDITSRKVQSITGSAKILAGPIIVGKITSSDGKYDFSCDADCNVVRTVSATKEDIIESIILSNANQNGLSIQRSLLYPDKVDVILDLAYTGSTQAENGYPHFNPKSIKFDDQTSSIKMEGVRLSHFGGEGNVTLSGELKAFAR